MLPWTPISGCSQPRPAINNACLRRRTKTDFWVETPRTREPDPHHGIASCPNTSLVHPGFRSDQPAADRQSTIRAGSIIGHPGAARKQAARHLDGLRARPILPPQASRPSMPRPDAMLDGDPGASGWPMRTNLRRSSRIARRAARIGPPVSGSADDQVPLSDRLQSLLPGGGAVP